ncbi:hypothetical protein D3C73_1151290 [compost metagenome]
MEPCLGLETEMEWERFRTIYAANSTTACLKFALRRLCFGLVIMMSYVLVDKGVGYPLRF